MNRRRVSSDQNMNVLLDERPGPHCAADAAMGTATLPRPQGSVQYISEGGSERYACATDATLTGLTNPVLSFYSAAFSSTSFIILLFLRIFSLSRTPFRFPLYHIYTPCITHCTYTPPPPSLPRIFPFSLSFLLIFPHSTSLRIEKLTVVIHSLFSKGLSRCLGAFHPLYFTEKLHLPHRSIVDYRKEI